MKRSYRFVVLCLLGAIMPIARAEAAGPKPAELADQIDRSLTAEVLKGKDRPVVAASDEVFLRRVYLDLIGQPPTTADVTLFALDADSQKRSKAVEKLLGHSQFGVNWARYWRDVILYRRTEDRALIVANTMTSYLTDEFNKNTPWDQIARSFITASGDVKERGDTALIMAQQGRPEETVAEVSRIFVGIQIQCAQCHDHPTDKWTREQFHELAAFFPRVAVRPAPEQQTFQVVVQDTMPFFKPRNEMNRFRGTLEHRMPDLKDPSAAGKLMKPAFFVTGQSLKDGTRDADRRGQLASWVTSSDNPWFAKAYVNRLWSELVGEGFYEPVDDLGPERTCTAPKTLDLLAAGFVASGHDTKWLLQTITSTAAYQRASRSRRAADSTPFVANCSQRLRSDQLFNSLVSLLNIPENGPSADVPRKDRRFATPRFLFGSVFGYDPSEPREELSGTIPQALALMNSPILNGAISGFRPGGLGEWLRELPKDDDLVTELYLRAYSREPTASELQTCLLFVKQVGNRREAFEDLMWALMNSTEFQHRR